MYGVKKIMYVFFKIYALPLILFVRWKPLYGLVPMLQGIYEWTHDVIMTCSMPLHIVQQFTISNREDIAIVIQGPVCYEDDFTINMIQRYRRFYHKAPIILSTWNGVKVEFLKQCQSLHVKVIQSDLPINSGVGNINYQLKSSYEGVFAARQLSGVKYIVKTRTDQTFCRHDFLDILVDMSCEFPVENEKLFSRLIFLNCRGTYRYIPFYMCDFMVFGSANDIYSFYDISMDLRDKNTVQMDSFVKLRRAISACEFIDDYNPYADHINLNQQILSSMPAEIYFVSQYYDKNIEPIHWENGEQALKQYWRFLKTSCIVLDEKMLEHYWFKYIFKFRGTNRYQEDGALDFFMWLRLYQKDL